MYRLTVCVCFFFPPGISICARTFAPNVGWGGHDLTVGPTLPEVFSRSVQCVARGKSSTPYIFSALGTLKANPHVSATSPGIGFLYPIAHLYCMCIDRANLSGNVGTFTI